MTEIIAEVLRPAKGSQEEWCSFDEISTDLAVGRLGLGWFDELSAIVHQKISEHTAPPTAMQRVQEMNPDSFWGLFRRNEDGTHELIGFYGQLLLNEAGHTALLNRTLDRFDPQTEFLSAFRAEPRAVYIWCLVAKKKAAILQAALMKQLQEGQSGMPYYAALATADSIRLGKQTGLVPVTPADDCLGGLFRFPDALPILRPSTTPPPTLAKVVHSKKELRSALSVRTAVFVEEQHCPAEEEFDGNDYSAQHLIGYVDGQPVATMRIRYFGGFAKWERFCVLKPFRKSAIKDELLKLAVEIVRRKGFQTVYFHAEPFLGAFWEKRGFTKSAPDIPLWFSDREYLQCTQVFTEHERSLSMTTAAIILNRPEGQWDIPGVLDASVSRKPRGLPMEGLNLWREFVSQIRLIEEIQIRSNQLRRMGMEEFDSGVMVLITKELDKIENLQNSAYEQVNQVVEKAEKPRKMPRRTAECVKPL